jgi:hypothetical protein
MHATLPDPGTRPVDQSLDVFQLPPLVAVQVSVHAGNPLASTPAAAAGATPAGPSTTTVGIARIRATADVLRNRFMVFSSSVGSTVVLRRPIAPVAMHEPLRGTQRVRRFRPPLPDGNSVTHRPRLLTRADCVGNRQGCRTQRQYAERRIEG